MQLLVIGGSAFIGAHVVRRLVAAGHSVSVFHRGQTQVDLPPSVVPILGDRKNLSDFTGEFHRLAPEVVIEMVSYAEQDALALMRAFRGIARRVVVISSMDVYRSYERLAQFLDENITASTMVFRRPLKETESNGDDQGTFVGTTFAASSLTKALTSDSLISRSKTHHTIHLPSWAGVA